MSTSIRTRPSIPDLPANQLVAGEDIASIAKALGHPARIQIVRLLLEKQSCIAGDIVDEVGLAQSTVSEHLRILRTAGLIAGEIEGPRVCYCLNPRSLWPLAALLNAVFEKDSRGELADGTCCPGTSCGTAASSHPSGEPE
ncbi:MAG: winged helix-turn-helix transcriptional regulator [Rhodobacteraceae bacterium]|nr:winged helix-turn-helix transcriptional regulator [Paracoccaceae bacterium]